MKYIPLISTPVDVGTEKKYATITFAYNLGDLALNFSRSALRRVVEIEIHFVASNQFYLLSFFLKLVEVL